MTKTDTKTTLMHLLKTSIAAFVALLVVGCAPDVPSVTPTQAADLLANKQAVIIDVREQGEWDEYHIDGAMFIPLSQIKKHVKGLANYKDRTVIMQCRSGRRSKLAADTLIEAGFSKVFNLEGGILAWEKEGLSTVAGKR